MGGKVPAPVGFCSVMSSGKFWFGNNLPSCPARGLLKARQEEQRKKKQSYKNGNFTSLKKKKKKKNPDTIKALGLSYLMLHNLPILYLSEKHPFLTFKCKFQNGTF